MTDIQVRYNQIQEQARSNRANEMQKRAELDEMRRSNIVREGYSALELAETQRSNLARENETARHNRNQEHIDSWRAQDASNRGWADLQIAAAGQRETTRSNLARETETNRSNVAKETETRRSNVAHENITSDYNWQNLQQQKFATLVNLAGSVFGSVSRMK